MRRMILFWSHFASRTGCETFLLIFSAPRRDTIKATKLRAFAGARLLWKSPTTTASFPWLTIAVS